MERGLFYKFRTVIYIFLVAVMAGVIFCIYPANTQIREVIVAYYHFMESRKQESKIERKSDVQQNTQVVVEHGFYNNSLRKIINWIKRI